MALLDFLSPMPQGQFGPPAPSTANKIGMALSKFGEGLGRVASNPILQSIGQLDTQRLDEEHMNKVFAANPAFASQLYGAKNNQEQIDIQKQSALAKLAEAKRGKYEQVGSALLKILPDGSFEEVYNAGADLPSTIQIANEVEKALSEGNIDRANRLMQIQKVYDKGINPYGIPTNQGGGYTPDFNPNARQAPSLPDGGYSEPPIGAPGLSGFPDIAAGEGPVLDDSALAQLAQSMPNVGGNIPMPAMGPQAIPGYGPALGSIAADKKRMETQAQKEVEAAMNPIVAGGEAAARLAQELEAKPKIEAAVSAAKFMEEGRQGLPKVQRTLQARELQDEFIDEKASQIAERASGLTTGFTGSLTDAIPGTPAFDLKNDVDTLLAAAGFDKLQEMRDNSPTGGALGQVSERELALLQASAQNLRTSQSKEQFLRNLDSFQRQRKESLQNMRRAYEQDYKRFGGQRDENLPEPSGGSVINWGDLP